MVKRNNYNGEQLVNKEFGIQVRDEMALVDARVLPPPMVITALECFSNFGSIDLSYFNRVFMLIATA
jgi:hypothetical protein